MWFPPQMQGLVGTQVLLWSFFLLLLWTKKTSKAKWNNFVLPWSFVLLKITPDTGFSPHSNGSTDIQGAPGVIPQVTPRVNPPPQGLPGGTPSPQTYHRFRKLQSSLSSSQPGEMALWRLVSVFFFIVIWFCILYFQYSLSIFYYLLPRTTSEFRNGSTASRVGIMFFSFLKRFFWRFRIVLSVSRHEPEKCGFIAFVLGRVHFGAVMGRYFFFVLLLAWFCLSRRHEPEKWLFCRRASLLFWESAFLCCHG